MSGVTNDIVPIFKLAATNAVKKAQAHLDKEKVALEKNIPKLKESVLFELDKLATSLPPWSEEYVKTTVATELHKSIDQLRGIDEDLNEESLNKLVASVSESLEGVLEEIATNLLGEHQISINEIMINLNTITRTEDIDLYTDPDGPWILEHWFGTFSKANSEPWNLS